jgi:hypothetical protein
MALNFGLCGSTYRIHWLKTVVILTLLARKFASTIDDTVEYAQANDISDDDFRIAVNNALCDILGVDEPDLL